MSNSDILDKIFFREKYIHSCVYYIVISSKNCLKCGSQNITFDDDKFSCENCGLSFCTYTMAKNMGDVIKE